jgi:hypothetical protein
MLITLQKKVSRLYKMDIESIPIEVFSNDSFRQGLYNEYIYTIEDFKTNFNVEPVIVNFAHVREVAIYTKGENELDRHPMNDYLTGAQSIIYYSFEDFFHVVEELQTIQQKLGIA